MRISFSQLRLIIAGFSFASMVCPASRAAQTSRDPQTSGPSTTVVIDAGHGGFDRGGIPGQRIPEKEMTLDVAQRLKGVLTAAGYRVVMTRDSDVFVPLATRVAIANSYRNAIFVCIHFNSAKRMGAGGIETYFTAATACRSLRPFIIMSREARRRPIAECGAAVSTFCERRGSRQCWSSADF